MKKLQSIVNSPLRNQAVRTPVLILLTAASAVMVWFSAAPTGRADPTCTVCHKRTQTLVLICGSLDYRRHKDHGDPDGPCAATNP